MSPAIMETGRLPEPAVDYQRQFKLPDAEVAGRRKGHASRFLAVSTVVALIFGCACTPKAVGDEAGVMATMDEYRTAFLAGDVEALLALYSEDWRDHHGSTKEDLKTGYEGMREKGGHKGLEVDLSEIEAVVDGDTATVTPVTLSSPEGSITYTHTLKKEADGVWRLIRTDTLSWEAFEMDRGGEEAQSRSRCVSTGRPQPQRASPERSAPPRLPFRDAGGHCVAFDPNGAIYWKGRYHLFYIFQDKRSGTKLDHWGHISSTDLFHWRHHPTGLLEGMYSGNCFINKRRRADHLLPPVGQGNAMAVALDDDLNEWKKLDTNPITPKTREGDEHHGKYRSWDPHGWLEGDTYYAIFGGQRPAVVKAPTLGGEWRYVGDLFAHGVEGVSLDEDVSCPDLFKLGDKDVLLCISHDLGCRYYLGEWKNEQFYPESHERMSWVDHSFFAPESLVDDKGRRIMWAWILDAPEFGVRWEQGWSGTMSLPRVLSLGDDGQLRIDVPEEIEALRYGAFKKENFALQSGADVVDRRHRRQQPRAVHRDGERRGVGIRRQGVCFARRAGGDLHLLRRFRRQAEGGYEKVRSRGYVQGSRGGTLQVEKGRAISSSAYSSTSPSSRSSPTPARPLRGASILRARTASA